MRLSIQFLVELMADCQVFFVWGVDVLASPHRADSAMIAMSISEARASMTALALAAVRSPSSNSDS